MRGRGFGVTISGVDESVGLEDLWKLTKKYPFVEWGLLYSAKNAGKKPRYPSPETIRLITSAIGNCSLHLCGDVAFAVRKGLIDVRAVLDSLLSSRKTSVCRVQINGWVPGEIVPLTLPERTILQARGSYAEIREQLAAMHYPPEVLFDPSGGRGIVGSWPSPEETVVFEDVLPRIGFAGGINPKNVDEVIDRLLERTYGSFWIDMESGVRKPNDDARESFDGGAMKEIMDLEAVERVLEIAGRYQGGSR